MGQGYFIDYTKISFAIFSYALIKMLLYKFCPIKKRLQAKNKDKLFDFMDVLLASKNIKII